MSKPHEPTIRKFNPGTFQPDDEVIRQFVVRQRELGLVLDVVRNNLDAPACQHVLLVAPRGRGKTMLLARVAAEVRTNAALAERLVPVRFMEESQEVFDMGDFWLEALFHLAGETAESHPDLSRELSATQTDLAGRWAREDLEDRARAAVLDAADRLDKKLVLMVENMQTLSRDVDDDFGWKLRKTLQTEPRIMLLATATSRFAGLDDADEPFFELFRTVCLEPLDTEECRRVWQMVGGEDRGREIRPLQILTGGNPRLLVIVADFARHRSLRQLMEELVTLIDDHTEYFRGHLEGFAKTERRVYLAVIDLWRPSSTGEVARRARLDVRSVSALLKRLVDRGAVVVEGSGRRRLYAAAERLYSIYYKLRRQRDEAAVVRSLIDFMVVFYSKDELTDMFRLFRAEAAQWPAIREGIERAMAESPQIRETLQAETLETTASETTEWLKDAVENATSEDDFKKIIEAADRFLGSESANSSPLSDSSVADTLGWKADAHSKLGETDKQIAVYDEIIRRFEESDEQLLFQTSVAWALVNKGLTYDRLGDSQAAVAAYDTVVQRFEESDAPPLQVEVARALVSKGGTYHRLGDPQAAVAAYDRVIRRFEESDAPPLQGEVARALVNKGITYNQLGDSRAAVAAYDTVIRRFEESDAPPLQGEVARALVSKGVTYHRLGDSQAAVAAYDRVIQRFEESDDPLLQGEVARALVNKGITYNQLGDLQAAVAAYDTVIQRFEKSDDPLLQVEVARALVNKGVIYVRLGDLQAAVVAYDTVIQRFGSSHVPELQTRAAPALFNKGATQAQLGRLQEALHTWNELQRKFHALQSDDGIAFGWQAMCMKSVTLLVQGNHSAAMEEFRSVYAGFVPNNEAMKWHMVRNAMDLAAYGASTHHLATILSSDEEKAAPLAPLVVALRRQAGEDVRAPAEVLEVAEDIIQRIEERKRDLDATPLDTPNR